MAYREVTMFEVREVLRQHLAGVPKKKIAARLGLDPKTVRRYVRVAGERGVAHESELTDEQLAAVMSELTAMPGRPRGDAWERCVENRARVEKLLADGVKLTKVRKLLLRQGVSVPYATLHRFAVEELGFGRKAATVPVEDGAPGDEVQLDTGWLTTAVEDHRGRRRRVRVWIFTPSASRYRFVWPCFEESTANAIEACERAWDFYGGVFRTLIPDNTKAIISKADPLEPRVVDGFLEYAQDRGFLVDPARVRRPTDKARVERSVRYVRDDCFGGEVIASMSDARRRALWWCEHEAGMKRHSRTLRVPKEHFEAVDKPALLPAPPLPYDVPHWSSPKVARDHYAQVRRALYSLPSRYIGRTLRARADSQTVRFYDGPHLIKTHPRKPPGGRSTDENDFPEHARAIARRDLAFVQKQARRHGEHVGKLAERLLDAPLPWTRVRRVYALIGLAKKHGSARLDQACELALSVGLEDVHRLKRIVEQGTMPTQLAVPHTAVLPTPRFLRPANDYALSRRNNGDDT